MTDHQSSASTESNTDDALCRLVQQWLPGYLRGELTAVQQRQVQAHLATCDRCAQQVQEARLLTNDLQTEADRYQPRLSQDASLRIQGQVYKKMQRSLVWQRTGQVVRMGTAFAALIVLLAGSFVFGRFWLDALANPPADVAVPGDTATLPEAPQPEPTAVPTSPPAISPPQPVEAVTESVGNGRINAWDHWVATAPGQTPEQLAATIMDAALMRDTATLTGLFIGMGATQLPTANMWLRIGIRCPGSLAASDFEFTRRPIPLPTVSSVSIWYNSHQVGEIKMRQVQGEWFATYTRTPAVNPCLHQ